MSGELTLKKGLKDAGSLARRVVGVRNYLKEHTEGIQKGTYTVSRNDYEAAVRQVNEPTVKNFINSLTKIDAAKDVGTVGKKIPLEDYQKLVIHVVFNYAQTIEGELKAAGIELPIVQDLNRSYKTKYNISEQEAEEIRAGDTAPAPPPASNVPVTCADLEQKFLINNLDILSRRNMPRLLNPAGYTNFTTVLGDPSAVMARINGNRVSEPLFRILPAQQALLVPKIRLFKVMYPNPVEEPARRREVELVFKDYLEESTIDRILSTGAGRGDGVGITSIDLEYTGENPWEASRLLKVKMRLYFESFADLFTAEKIREAEEAAVSGKSITTPDGPDEASFIDLIWRVSSFQKNPETGEREENPNYYQIKMVLGWAIPADSEGLIPDDLMVAIRQHTLVVYLNQIDHTLEFNQDGSISLSIEYRARTEELMDSAAADIFQSIEYKKQRKALRKDLKKTRETLGNKDTPPAKKEEARKKVSELKKQERTLLDATKKERLNSIINGVIDRESLRAINPRYEDFANLRRMKNFTAASTSSDAQASSIKQLRTMFSEGASPESMRDLNDNLFNNAPTIQKGHYRLHYFFLGDLLDIVIETVKRDNPTMADVEFLMTTFEYKNPFVSADTMLVPLANIPIALSYFNDWMAVNVVGRRKQSYYLLRFIKDFLHKVVIRSLNFLSASDSPDRRKNYKTQIGFKIFSLPKVNGKAPLQPTKRASQQSAPGSLLDLGDLERALWDSRMLLDKDLGDQGSTDYVVFYPYTSEMNSRSGNYNEDFENGVYHLQVGQDGGLVEKVSFSKTQTPYLAEANFVNQERSIKQLFRTYDATVEMYGNFLFVPGSAVYINPSFMSNVSGPASPNSVFRRFGIGGYYRANKVNVRITSREFHTTLICKWISSGDKEGALPIAATSTRRRGGA